MRNVFALILLAALAGPLHAETGASSPLTLSQARQLMLEKNRELLAGKRAVEGLQADILTAGQKPNPTLSLNSTNWRVGQSNGSGLWDKRVDTVVRVDQLIERGNKRELRTEAAQQAAEAGRLDVADLQRQQAVALDSAYYDLLLAQEKERINRETADLQQQTLAAQELRLKAGDVSAADVARVRVEALRAQNDWRSAVADREKAQTDLAYLIGMESTTAGLVATDDFPAVETPGEMPDDAALLQRPGLQAAQARVRMAEKQRELARAQQTRDITVGVQYEHFPTDTRNSIGAGVSIPLFTNYQYQGEIARAEVNLTAATEDLERQKALAVAEIGKARTDLLAAAERVRRFDQSVLQEAQKSADAATFAYQHGALGVTDMLDARRTLRALQLEAAATRADYAKANALWHAAINSDLN
jgi:cobalt-zinc-cadmium efflux system outer membrane protein